MHRRWMSLPLLTSAVTAFYPYHDGHGGHTNEEKRFVPLHPFSGQSDGELLKIDIKKVYHKRDNSFPVVLSNQPKDSDATAISQDGQDYSYFSTVKFGSDDKEMYMLIDTGSANTWVMGQDCASQSCKIHNLFGPADSTSLNVTTDKWSLSYGTGTVSGVVASDDVKFANYSLNLGFGLATTASNDFNNYPMDGILGLGRATSNELGVPTVMETLKTQGKLAQNIIGVHLNRGSDSTKDGEIVFGSVNPDKYTGNIAFTKTSNMASWEVPVDDVIVNNTPCGFTSKSAIVDTGTSYVLMPPSDAAKLHSLITGSTHNGETYTVPCDTSASVQVSISGVKYGILPKDYVGSKTSGNMCNSNIIGHQAFGVNDWILGDVFLKNVYTVFDFDRARVGFGMLGSGGSTSGVITSSPTQSGSPQSTTLGTSTTASTATASSTSSSSQPSSTEGNGSPFDGDNSSSSSSSQKNTASSVTQPINITVLMLIAFLIGLSV